MTDRAPTPTPGGATHPCPRCQQPIRKIPRRAIADRLAKYHGPGKDPAALSECVAEVIDVLRGLCDACRYKAPEAAAPPLRRFVINGEPHDVPLAPPLLTQHKPLSFVFAWLLTRAGYGFTPFSAWQLRDAAGALLWSASEESKSVGDLPPGELFLNLRAGVAAAGRGRA